MRTDTCTHETGPSSCSHGVEGVLDDLGASLVQPGSAVLHSLLFWVTYCAFGCELQSAEYQMTMTILTCANLEQLLLLLNVC